MKLGYCDELEQEELDMQVREDDDKVLFPPQETPEALSDMAVLDNSTVVDSGGDKMYLSDIGEVEETASEAPRNSEALAAIRTLQMYAIFRGDKNAIGDTIDLQWYSQLITDRMASELRQTSITEFFKNSEQ
ncbi:hypothetical protein LOD99_6323 [Oopsacas minuta]|uniref:Uncharacterized protein n=1 Tax=Oopsacas minuta TaxID=111878 RepID=A0AAV7JNB7_9METZ|nr:hypothetical protein LOD99_6323 [Oopsacas minuta]